MVSSRLLRGSSARSRTEGSRAFYRRVIARRRCKPDEGTYLESEAWTDVRHFIAGTRPERNWRTTMGDVIRFVTRAELERMRLAREGRTRNRSILPPAASVSEPRDQKSELADS